MSKAGESYWRCHVELQALPPEERDGMHAAPIHVRQDALWDKLTPQDKEELQERLRIAKGE